jgi:hypothetical protein
MVSANSMWSAIAIRTRSEAAHPIGYVLVDLVDGNANVEQVSVRPDRRRPGTTDRERPEVSLAGGGR